MKIGMAIVTTRLAVVGAGSLNIFWSVDICYSWHSNCTLRTDFVMPMVWVGVKCWGCSSVSINSASFPTPADPRSYGSIQSSYTSLQGKESCKKSCLCWVGGSFPGYCVSGSTPSSCQAVARVQFPAWQHVIFPTAPCEWCWRRKPLLQVMCHQKWLWKCGLAPSVLLQLDMVLSREVVSAPIWPMYDFSSPTNLCLPMQWANWLFASRGEVKRWEWV